MPEFGDRLLPSQPNPLGARWDGRGTHFSVWSGSAERVELCLFDAAGRHETRLDMPECTDGIWHGYLPGARPGLLYGYRVHGPYEPRHGLRFNPNKLLLDPYARRLSGPIRWHDALHGYRIGAPKGDLSFDRRDSAAYMPKAVLVDEHFEWRHDHAPRVPWSDTVIYELHVKGFTKRREDLPEHDRGTFGALGHRSTIEYLKGLGVTAVELLPVHTWARDRHLLERGLTNYWGYNTLGFFAPDLSLLSDGTLGQMKWAVQQLHAAGIEVILDVVYNHTCEGSELGPTLSLRGFGDGDYYVLSEENRRHHVNHTGCGNSLDFTRPRTIQLVLDSLRYWVQEFHVDGFRFDLSATLGRETYGFDPHSGFFDAMMQDPLLAQVKLIAEPWDTGPGGYQTGNHPAGMAEWNDRFRDDVRKWWKGDGSMRGAVAARLHGSADLFDHHRRRPWASVNFVTAHDGFTLEDLVSYTNKYNEANGEDNHDGNDSNESNNWGAEGASDDPLVLTFRDRTKRNFLASILFSHGTPMLLAGDEFGQTQQGNNNTYCQDNELSWLDWSLPRTERGNALRQFVARAIALRKQYPVLQGRYFQHAKLEVAPGLRDITWFDERGVELTQEDWENGAAHLLGMRRAALCDDGRLEILTLLLNADAEAHEFILPRPRLEHRVMVDTADDARRDQPLPDGACKVEAWSLVLLVCQTRREAILPEAAAVEEPLVAALEEEKEEPAPATEELAEAA